MKKELYTIPHESHQTKPQFYQNLTLINLRLRPKTLLKVKIHANIYIFDKRLHITLRI